MKYNKPINYNMLRGILFLIPLLILCGCNNKPETPHVIGNDGIEYNISIIDGCEYIQCRTYYGYVTLTHKGNCTNKIHQLK